MALIATLGTLAGIVGVIVGLLPKSPEALAASFSDVSAYPEVSLEEFDARSEARNVVESVPSSAATGAIVYRMASYTATSSTPEGATTHTESAPRASTQPQPPPATTSTTSAPATKGNGPRAAHGQPSGKGKQTRAPSTTTTPNTGAPTSGSSTEGSATEGSSQSQPDEQPPTPHKVNGALVTEGNGAPETKVAAAAGALASIEAAKAATPPGNEEEVGAAPPEGGSEETTPEPKGAVHGDRARVALPSRCGAHCGGVTQEIEKALTYSPNPVKAAEAVEELFKNSRGQLVDHVLHPVGAMVSYTVELDGFAGKRATLEWSLFSAASGKPLPRPWWRDVVVARVQPTVNHETFSSSFWVPVPPTRGNYVVHMVVLDSHGVPHATSDSTPTFH